MRVIVASTNSSKIQGTLNAFEKYFSDVSVEGVSVGKLHIEQPLNEDIYLCANERMNKLIESCKKNDIIADYYVVVESGITNALTNIDEWLNISMALICDENGTFTYGISSGFAVPNRLIGPILEKDLKTIVKSELKVDEYKGAIDALTKGKCTRIDLSSQAVEMAMIQIINKDWI